VRWLTKRRAAWIGGSLVVLLLIAAVTTVLVVQSDWFYNKVRLKLITVVENATGGRVEIGRFHFDWRHLRAEVWDFVVHGTEPAGKPPLLRVPHAVVDLKLISISRRDVDIQALEVTAPQIYLIIGPDGRTNVPEPKVKSNKSTVQGLLDAAIGRLAVERGLLEVEAHTATPFHIRGENVAVNLGYEAAGPRYRGTFAAAPLRVKYDDYGPEPFHTNLAFTLEKERIVLESGKLTDGPTQVDLSGGLMDLTKPHATFRYTARTSLGEIARIFRVRELRQGAAVVSGTGGWNPGDGLSLKGSLHATGVEYRDSTVRLAGFRAEGAVSVGDKGVTAQHLALSGDYVRGDKRERIEGQIAEVTLRRKDLDARGVALALLGGTFGGNAEVRGLDHFTVVGEIAGFDARRAAALYTPEALPWDALASGPVTVAGSLKRPTELHATGNLTISPAPSGDNVNGQINAIYDARNGGNLDLGQSTISLPHTRADFSGSLGHELKVHLETSDLNDMLPALSKSASSLPVTLKNGNVVFDGSVTGNLESPRIVGHMRAANVVYQQEPVDSLEADVQAASDSLRLQNAVAARGPLRAQFQGSIGLSEWKTSDASPVSATATVSNASAADILALANVKDVPFTGTISGTAAANGTLGKMSGQGDVTAVNGKYKDEPYDRFTAHATYADNTIQLTAGRVTAGVKQLDLSGTYHHTVGRFDEGRVHFQVSSNAMPVEQIHTLAEERPDIQGTVKVTASGDVDLTPSAKTAYRIADLHADLTAAGVRLGGEPLGDAHLTASSQGQRLIAHLDSTIAGSTVRGDGEWRIEGDYPGSATVHFSKVDLAHLKRWLAPGGEPPRFAGSAEGDLRVEGPAQHWQAMTAELRIHQFEIGAAPETRINGQAAPTLRNSGDLVFRFANSTITAATVHLVSPGTDLAVTGRISPELKAPLDLRVDGKLDLAFLHDFFPDFTASGGVATTATVRGSLGDPQIIGRAEFKDATFNIADVPNGISKASGVITFNKDRANIQSLAGETGGGKIQVLGYVGYGGAHPTVFRLHARADEVRVRYPEGVSTVANANLNLTGTSDNSVLSGTVTILRTGVNLQSDFTSILSKSAQPLETPAAQTGLLAGMSFDVQIETSPDIQLQSSLTENVQAEANLKLRGTAASPALLGRINITQGKLTFFGTQYNLSQGTISFYNPVRIEPILNIDLETKARGVDITLTVSGPMNKLTLTPRSDPPLESNEIVALLATGRAPSSDPTIAARMQTGSQSWEQTGASALLGSAIANPVAGRLQRFFGVSNLRIDPTISGVENNPQARLTLEQQITPAITLTYITNVTTTNPQIIRVEWAFNKQWSAVALREENGLFGLDFFYKRRIR
jgi:translocation and assembly module TamB